METESRKKALQYFFDKVVGPMGFKFTPDVELKDFLLEQEVMLEAKHGIPFCPASRSAGTALAICRSSALAFLSTGNISTLSSAVGAACSFIKMSLTRTACLNCHQRTWVLGDKFIRVIGGLHGRCDAKDRPF